MKSLLSYNMKTVIQLWGMHFYWGQNKNLVLEGLFLLEGNNQISGWSGGMTFLSPIHPLGKTLIQVHTLIIVNECVFMYNVYCVAVENFNSGCKIDLSHQGK